MNRHQIPTNAPRLLIEVMHGLTPWMCTRTHSPERLGWYPVRAEGSRHPRRYWNGEVWSQLAHTWMSDDVVALQQAQLLTAEESAQVWWYGLARPHLAGYTSPLHLSKRAALIKGMNR